MSISSLKKFNSMFFKTIILFFTVFSIHLKAISITPRIIVLAMVSIYILFFKKIKCSQDDIKWVLKCMFVLLFTWFSMYINDAKQTTAELPASSAFNFLVFVGIFPIILNELFDDDTQFCTAMGAASTIQSVIVILSALTPRMRQFLQEIQNIDFSRYNFRIYGLGVAGAGGSIYLFSGLFSFAYLIYRSKEIKIWLPLLYVINFIAIAFVGRTGFYAAIVITVFIIVNLAMNNGKKTIALFGWSFLIIVGIIMVYNFAVVALNSNKLTLAYTFKRLWEGFNIKESKTFDKLNGWNKNLLPISLRTVFWGTGIVRGYTYDGLFISHDGGYAKRYMSIGLVMAIYSYIIFYGYMKKILAKTRESKSIISVCLIIMIFIEYKEPFMYQLALPFTVLMISKLKAKSENEGRMNEFSK